LLSIGAVLADTGCWCASCRSVWEAPTSVYNGLRILL